MKNKLLLCLLLVLTVFLASCGKDKITFGEIKEVLPTLVENSKALNEIYFGIGFKPLGEGSLDELVGYYYVDCDEYGLYSVSDIKDATEKIFTKEYAALLYKGAFDGLVNENVIISPKYVEGTYGLMQSMRADVYDLCDREYHYDTLNIVKSDNERMTVSLESVADGNVSKFEMIVVRSVDENGDYQYRLDSPTY
ncbi:MAG: hypothetical protein IKU61_04475 [Clostridia bacterium]|nr:hypothetical protein [Clostridia bacterium]